VSGPAGSPAALDPTVSQAADRVGQSSGLQGEQAKEGAEPLVMPWDDPQVEQLSEEEYQAATFVVATVAGRQVTYKPAEGDITGVAISLRRPRMFWLEQDGGLCKPEQWKQGELINPPAKQWRKLEELYDEGLKGGSARRMGYAPIHVYGIWVVKGKGDGSYGTPVWPVWGCPRSSALLQCLGGRLEWRAPPVFRCRCRVWLS